MPEGPEVRVVGESLSRDLLPERSFISLAYEEKRINSVHKKNISGYTRLQPLLPLPITAISVKGKKIVIWLHGDIFLVCSLGMTGRFCWERGGHTHVTMQLDNGKTLYYDDARGFGGIAIAFSIKELHDLLSDVGPCLLSERHLVTAELWNKELSNKRLQGKQIGDFLLDQKRFAGIGNYLKSEILYRAAISPYRSLGSLADGEKECLRIITFETIDESYQNGGLTIENYWDPYGRKGTYPCRVYGRKTDWHGNIVETVTLKDQRTTYWCPAVQK